MKLLVDTHGTVQMRICDDKSDIVLEMNYDDQLGHYEMATRDGESNVKPFQPVRRYDGEKDEVYFDRASLIAHQRFLETLEERIEEHSRYEQLDYIKSQAEELLSTLEQTFAHFEAETPTENDLDEARKGLRLLGDAAECFRNVA